MGIPHESAQQEIQDPLAGMKAQRRQAGEKLASGFLDFLEGAIAGDRRSTSA